MLFRSDFTRQLAELAAHVERFAGFAAADVRACALALAADEGAARGVLSGRKEAETLRGGIEASCMSILLLQQPVAGDLRQVTGSFRLVSDLMRVDEMCRDVAFMAGELPLEATVRLTRFVPSMSEAVATMVLEATAAFADSDVDRARGVFAMDDEVDSLFGQCEDEVVRLIREGDAPSRSLPELLMVAKYFERMGDHAQRIADWAVFRATGVHQGSDIE